MRLAVLLAAAALSACAVPDARPAAAAPEPSARYAFWRPEPVLDAPEPSRIVAEAPASEWRPVAPENLLVMDLADGGRVIIELAPDFAPVHVANIRAFARAGWWDGASVYRVQENYVAQWGNGDSEVPLPPGVVAQPDERYERPLEGLSPRPIGYPDSYAPMAGHSDGWPIAWDPERGRAWLAHCHAMVGVGRGMAPETGTGGELYAVIGHAPRHLDRNIALVGRVVEGLEHLSARPRGSGPLGFYRQEAGERPVPIARVRLASAMADAERPGFEAMRTDSIAFAAYVTGRANRGGEFFFRPAGGIDLCNALVPVRRRPG